MVKFLVALPKDSRKRMIMQGFSSALKICGILSVERNVENIQPKEMEQLRITSILFCDYDLFSNEDILGYLKEKKSIYQLINYFLQKPDDNDFNNILKTFCPNIFMWDSSYLDTFEKSTYLPLAINPDLYEPDFVQPKINISFAQAPLGDNIQSILASLSKLYRTKLLIYSNENSFLAGANEMREKKLLSQSEFEVFLKSYAGKINSVSHLAKIYSRSLINLNITQNGENALNSPVFEITGSCAFLLTDWQNDLPLFFNIGKEIETYKNEVDLVDKIDFYFKNPEIAHKIALAGYEKTLSKHTFIDRARTLLTSLI